MKRNYLILGMLSAAGLLTLVGTQTVWSKAHVPTHKVQVCHVAEYADITSEIGVVITVSENALDAHWNHGDCQVPSCDFANVFHTGDACNRTDAGSGRCPLGNPRDDAGGVTPGCPAGTY